MRRIPPKKLQPSKWLRLEGAGAAVVLVEVLVEVLSVVVVVDAVVVVLVVVVVVVVVVFAVVVVSGVVVVVTVVVVVVEVVVVVVVFVFGLSPPPEHSDVLWKTLQLASGTTGKSASESWQMLKPVVWEVR